MDKSSHHAVSIEGVVSVAGSHRPSEAKPDILLTTDDALNRKIFLVNNALDEIGYTWYHANMFVSAGLGLAMDAQIEVIHKSVRRPMALQFGSGFPVGTEAFYLGSLLGAIFWGFGADIIGRKPAFKLSLLLASAFGFLSGGMGSYATYCVFTALTAFCAGGNLSNDSVLLMEFCPSKYSWVPTMATLWWGVGRAIGTMLSWIFVSAFSCPSAASCDSSANHGWRYSWYAGSANVLLYALWRLFATTHESPKFLVSAGKDAEAISVLQALAAKYNRTCTLTLEELRDCGNVTQYHDFSIRGYTCKGLVSAVISHVKIIHRGKKIRLSTTLVLLSWSLFGASYHIYFNYVPDFGALSPDYPLARYNLFRHSALASLVGILGSVFATYLAKVGKLGRKGAMAIGATISMAVLFAYTSASAPGQEAVFACFAYVFLGLYAACLFTYTAEVFPTMARATGGAMGVSSLKFGGMITAVIYYYGQGAPAVTPLWVSGAVMALLAVVAVSLPFQTTQYRAV